MKALIVGLGSIGRRHIANLKSIDPTIHITVWHQHTLRQEPEDVPPGVDLVVYRLEDALAAQPSIAIISGPAVSHVQTAHDLARHGIHLFVEKPLSHTLDGVDALLDLCRQRTLVLMVGYNFRFYPPLQVMRQALIAGQIGRIIGFRAEVGQYLPDWRPSSDYRQSVSAQRKLGGGVVLELSHELDYAYWLMGDVRSVSAQIGQLGDLEIDVEDTAELTLQFCNGAIGSIHLDMVQRSSIRICRIVGTEGTIVWDGLVNRVQLYSASTGMWSDLFLTESLDRNEMYVSELRHFLACVRGDASPTVSGKDAKRVLQIALAAKQSSDEKRVIEI